MSIDDRDQQDHGSASGASAPLTPPAAEHSAVRGAFLARQGQEGARGGGDSEVGAATLRGAFLSRLTRTTRGRSPAVVGTEETGGAVLRGIYAARSVTVVVATPPRARSAAKRSAKAAPAKKARSAPKAKKAAGRRKPRVAAAARPAKRKKAAPARQVRKTAPKTRRRR
jgi:hypothetical protein